MSRTENKTRWFLVPKDMIGSFFTQLEDAALDYELIELEDESLKVEVTYDEGQRDEVMTLIELLDEHEQEEAEEES
jgi:hypothetical protein